MDTRGEDWLMTRSEALFERAQKLIPGGVNSPVRAFNAVGGCPPFIERASGARLYDADGREYIDLVCSWGPMVLGHAHRRVVEAVRDAARNGLSFGAVTEREVDMAALITELVPSVELVRMVNSGTEAVMSCIRVARGFTGRPKIIKFAGCYHGHSDGMLVKAGSGVLGLGEASSAGVTPGAASDTLVASFNDIGSVEALFAANSEQVAAVVTELIPANMGVVPPEPGFLEQLQALCRENGALFIADEVITGFRCGLGGAQEALGVSPDLTCFGKIIGGGMPVGAFGGRRDVMEQLAPCGPVYQAGTLSGNPVAMAAGLAQLTLLREDPSVYARLEAAGKRLADGLRELIGRYGVRATVNQTGSLLTLFFHEAPVSTFADACACDTAAYARYFHGMLDRGVYLAPSQYEAAFLSAAHTDGDIDAILERTEDVFKSWR